MNTNKAHVAHGKCGSCAIKNKNFFCNLSNDALRAFEKIKISMGYARGERLFTQGQPGAGVYMLCSGRAKLSICSKDGKYLILRLAHEGELLGLRSTLSNRTHQATAETLEPCQVNFISKKDFLKFIREYPDASQNLIKQLANNYSRACEQVRSLSLARSAAEKLARLFVTLLNGQNHGQTTATLETKLTHEEIGSMINASRETVTRLLKEFKRSDLISVTGSRITINDIPRLAAFADERVNPIEEASIAM
jgi:CRP/FNR family transcriptional regulator, cyclic AMP receptor protein